MYTYIFDGVGFTLLNPSKPEAEVLSQTAKQIVTRYSYEDGLVLEITQEASRSTILSNRPLVQNPDGTYSPSGK